MRGAVPDSLNASSDSDNLVFACSLAQERFWVLDRLDPGTPSLNIAVRWQLAGPVQPALLEAAIRAVIARHEILSTGFIEVDGTPLQCVGTPAFRLRHIDLSARPAAEIMPEAMRLGADEALAPFDLARPPLLRMTLLQLAADRFIVLTTIHHIVADGWSVGVLARDVLTAYVGLRTGTADALEPLPIQYGDFAAWQRETLAGPDMDAERSYWLGQLANLKPFEVPTDRPRPPIQTTNGAIASLLLPRKLTDALEALSRQHNGTLFMSAFACLAAMLHRLAGDTDMSLGTQVTGREQVELEDMVGLFINTLVLRLDAGGDPTMADLLARAQTTVRDALTHQHMPIEQLVALLKPARDLSRNPLFSINFIFQRSFIANASYGDVALVDLPSQSAGAMYDLNFFMVERPEGWRASCEFNTDLFDEGTVRHMLASWQHIMTILPCSSATRLSRLSVLDAAQREWLAAACNDTATAYPSESALAELLEAQAIRSPDALAVVAGADRLTFAALHAQANRLARVLRRRQIGPGHLVGICLDRGTDMMVALLAVLKAGAAYVPLDPGYPAARLAQMVEDAGLTTILASRDVAECVPPGAGALLLEDLAELAAAEPATPLGSIATADDLAYVIYTSGTTGRPKGVQVTHRSLVNLLCAMRDRPGLSPADTLVAVTTLSFDIAALELFLPLLVGARLVIALREVAADGLALAALLRSAGATVLQATPVTWQFLLEAGWRPGPGMRMLCGGEALPRVLADRLTGHGGTLWNMYGPTETTIWSAAGPVEAGSGAVTIGPPIANTQLHVLTAALEPVPPGGIGELFIGGDGVARGYRNRPELTAERFLRDPFRAAPHARLYRTGDVARRRADGRIEVLGRNDAQVKLRGYRIELGEIEAALAGHPAVQDAVAVIRHDSPTGGPEAEDALLGYVSVRNAQDASATGRLRLARDLRRTLSGRLPAHMVPATVTVLPALPRTPNGKIDRAALPAPMPLPLHDAPMIAPAMIAPPMIAPQAVVPVSQPIGSLSETEARLLPIWREILGLSEIGPDDNFFELGGHSLLAARMMARIETAFGERLRLATLFQVPTLRGLAGLLRTREEAAPADDHQILRVQPAGAQIPIIAINNSGVFHPLSRQLGTERPFIAVQLVDPDQPTALPTRSFEALAADYVALIRRVRPHGPYVLMGWCVAGVIAFEVAQQLRAAGEEVRLLVMVDSWAPGFTRSVSRWRARLARLSYHSQVAAGHLGRLLRGRSSLAAVLGRCGAVRRSRWVAGAKAAGFLSAIPAEDSDRWLQDYLGEHQSRYTPKLYPGQTLLLVRSTMPKGLFSRREFGWRALATGRLDVASIPGDHLSIFTGDGAATMARQIEAAMAPERPRP